MAVRIRLQRKGARHMAFYRIVAADSRSPRDGRFIEQLGYYDPLRDPPEIKVDTEKVIDWFRKGAQPTETVRSLLRRVGVMQTWHEVKKGRPLSELAYIEDEARKRIEAQAATDRRKKAEARKKRMAEASAAEAETAKSAAPVGAPADTETGANDAPAESAQGAESSVEAAGEGGSPEEGAGGGAASSESDDAKTE